MVGVFVAKKGADVKVAVTGANNEGVFRAEGLEAALKAKFNPKAVEGVAVDGSNFISDIHGTADYRANLVSVMTKRAVTKALGK